jgi:hypothetical protein
MIATTESYAATADELVRRISALIPKNPQILSDSFSAWDLFKVKGFKCDDLAPSAFQAGWALSKARALAADKSSGVVAVCARCRSPNHHVSDCEE